MMEEDDDKRSMLQIATAWMFGVLAIGCTIAAFSNPQHLVVAMICLVFALCVWYN